MNHLIFERSREIGTHAHTRTHACTHEHISPLFTVSRNSKQEKREIKELKDLKEYNSRSIWLKNERAIVKVMLR